MPLTADDIPALLQSKEFKALPHPERTRIAEDALAEGSASLAGAWDRDTYKQWGEFANTVRSDLAESETLVDKAKSVGGTLKQIGQDALGTIGTTVAGLSPVLPMPKGGFKGQIPGETLAPQLVTNLAGFGTGQAEKLMRDKTPVVNALADVRKGIDNGAFFEHPAGLNGWLDAVDGLVKENAVKYYGADYQDWATQNGLLGNEDNAALLNHYLRTRSPEAWTELEKNVLRTPAMAQIGETSRRLQQESTLGKALAPAARPLIQNAADPTEWIGAAKGLKAGAKAVSKGLTAVNRVKELGKGMLYEQLGEQLSANISDPNLSWEERAGIAKQALIGSLGFAGAGAVPGAIKQIQNGLKSGTTLQPNGQPNGTLPGTETPPTNPFEGPITAPPQPTEAGGVVEPAGPVAGQEVNGQGGQGVAPEVVVAEQERQQMEGALPPPTPEQVNRPPVEVVPVPEEEVQNEPVMQPTALQALQMANAQLPQVAQAKWTPEVYAAAEQFFQTGDGAVLQVLTPIQQRRVINAHIETNAELKRQIEAQDRREEHRTRSMDKKDQAFEDRTTFKRELAKGLEDETLAMRRGQNFTAAARPALAAASSAARGAAVPAQTTVANQAGANAWEQGYTNATQGTSTVWVPIKRVFEKAQALDPALTPQAFLEQVHDAYLKGSVGLEPPENKSTVDAAGPFTLRQSNGIVSTNMMVMPPTAEAGPSQIVDIRSVWPELSNIVARKAEEEGTADELVEWHYKKLPPERQRQIDQWYEENEQALERKADAVLYERMLSSVGQIEDTPTAAFELVQKIRDLNHILPRSARQGAVKQFLADALPLLVRNGIEQETLIKAVRQEFDATYGANAEEMAAYLLPEPQRRAASPGLISIHQISQPTKSDDGPGLFDEYLNPESSRAAGGTNDETLAMASPGTAGPLPTMHTTGGPTAPQGGYPAGPQPQLPQGMSAYRSNVWSGKVQTLHGIRKFLLDAVGLPAVGVKRFTQQALGIYKTKPEAIRLQAINDIPVLAHEIGHHVHYRFLSATRGVADDWGGRFDAELMPMGQPTSAANYTPDMVRKEGVAEFTRLWLTNPVYAWAHAPNFAAFWNAELEAKAPEIAAGMEQAQGMIADYIAMPAFEKAKAQVVMDPDSERPGTPIGQSLRKFYAGLVNTLQPALDVMKSAAQMQPALQTEADNVVQWMENHRGGWASKATSDVFGRQTDLHGKVVGDGLQTILKDLRPGEHADFSTYLALKRAAEIERSGKRSGFEQARLPAAEMRVLEQRFEATRQKLMKWQQNELQLLVDAGLLDSKSAADMKQANADYVPFYRLYEKLNGVSFGPENSKNAGGYVDLNSGIRALKGSDRAIIDPLQSVMKNAFMFRKIAEQNLIGQKFFDVVKQVQGGGQWGEGIAPKMKPNITSHDAIVQKLIDEGIIADASMLPANADLTLRLYQAVTKPDTKNGEVIIFRDGKREHWEVKDPLLMQALKTADADAAKLAGIPGWMKAIFTLPTRTLRWGATGGPWFAIPNAIRDTVQAGILSKNGFIPFWDTARGAIEVLRKGGAFQAWQQAGGEFSGQITGTQAFTRLIDDVLPKDPVMQRMLQGLAEPKAWRTGFNNALELIGWLSKVSEQATRVGEFMRAKEKGATDMAAANFSKIVSLNFARAGETSRVINQFVPFFNATLQGLDQLVRAHGDPKQRTAAMVNALMYVTVPTLLVWALGKDDEEIQNLPDKRKELFWNINLKPMATALGMPEKGFILSIPKPFLLGAIYGTSIEHALNEGTGRDPNGAKKAAKNILANTMNPFDVMMSIGGIRPVIEASTNHSLFTDRDIVPQGYQYLPKEQQYSVLTSQTARMLGKFTGQSPMMIDHLLRGYFATAGTFGADAIDYGMAKLALTDVPPPPRKGWMELPILNRFAGSPYASNAFVGRFYNASKDMEGKIAVLNKQAEQMTSKEQQQWFAANRDEIGHYLRTVDYQTGRTGAGDIRKAQATLSEINAAMKEIQASRVMKPELKQQRMLELAHQKNEVAENAFKALFPETVKRRHY